MAASFFMPVASWNTEGNRNDLFRKRSEMGHRDKTGTKQIEYRTASF